MNFYLNQSFQLGFPFQNNPKNLDPSNKMDLDFWDCFVCKMDLDFCDCFVCKMGLDFWHCFVCKMDLDFWHCFGREEPHHITVDNMVMPMTDTNDC